MSDERPTPTAAASFPAAAEQRPLPAGSRRVDGRSQQGVAVLMVLTCLAILAPFIATFNYQARVDWQASVNVRDEVAARQIQRGSMQLSLLLFEVQRMVFNQEQFREALGITMDITQVAPYLMSAFGTEDGAEGLGSLVGIDTSALQGLAISGGTFEYRVTAESGKINLNCMGAQPADPEAKDNPAGRATETLEALMLPVLFDPYFEEQKSDGQYYTRSDIVRNLADYIDDDRNVFDLVRLRSASSRPESYRYTQLFDPYRERNARLDSVDELHLVEGIDDDWMAAFGHELTVYGQCKVNLNFASAEQIALVLRHAVAADDKWKTEGENFLLKALPLANYVVESRQFSLFPKLDAFKELVAAPDQHMSPLAMMGGEADKAQSLPRIPEGMEVRVNGGTKDDETWGGLSDVATVSPESIYRVEVITEVGAVKKRLVAVYDMKYQRTQSQGLGAWLYMRED